MKASLLLALAGLSVSTAQAAESEQVTLACKGTEAVKGVNTHSEQINIGVLVDLQKKEVIGLSNSPVAITNVDETKISFSVSERDWRMNGTIDRVTGALIATSTRSNPDSKQIISSQELNLQCKPTQRMF
jgi:hypothetical protein